MARHRKEYEGERLTANLHLQMTPTDRAGVAAAAAEQGLSAGEFGRALVLNGLRAYRAGGSLRETYRQSLVKAVAQLTEAGERLNDCAKMANRAKRIESEASVVAVCAELVDLLKAVPPRMTAAPKDPQTRKLVAALAAIGNNVQQLKRLAKSRLHMRSAIALRGVEAAVSRVEKALGSVDAGIAETLNRVLPA